jgi:hypothetical protein
MVIDFLVIHYILGGEASPGKYKFLYFILLMHIVEAIFNLTKV